MGRASEGKWERRAARMADLGLKTFHWRKIPRALKRLSVRLAKRKNLELVHLAPDPISAKRRLFTAKMIARKRKQRAASEWLPYGRR